MNFSLKTYSIRLIQNGRKKKTVVEGLDDDLDIPYIAKCLRRELKCSAAKKRNAKTDADVLLLTGDKRTEIKNWLIKAEIARDDEIKFRG